MFISMRCNNIPTFTRLLVALQVLSLTLALLPLNAADLLSRFDEVSFAETSLQEQNTVIFQLKSSDYPDVVSAIVIGGSGQFSINLTNLTIYNNAPVSAQRYPLTIQLQQLLELRFVFLTVNVMPPPNQACALQLFGSCTQHCVLDNSTYGYTCVCAEGYILQQDRVTCLAFDPSPSLLVATDNGISHIDQLTRVDTPMAVSGDVDFLDYLYDEKVLFYADNTRHVIAAVMIENFQEMVFHDYGADTTVQGLAVNWVDQTVLYASSQDGVIREVNFQTQQNVTILASLNQPRQLVFYANLDQRMLFWIEGQGQANVIRRSFSNGSGVIDIVSPTEYVIDLSVDLVNDNIYWLTDGGRVCYSSLNGNDVHCFNCCDGDVPVGLTVFEVFIYVSLRDINTVVQMKIQDGSVAPNVNIEYRNLIIPGDLIVLHPLRQPPVTKEVSNCSQCQQLCVVQTNSVTCDCSPGFRLSNDGRLCYVDEISDIVLAQSVEEGGSTVKNQVVKVSADGREFERLVDLSFGSGQDTGVIYAMDYDHDGNIVYYGDRNSSTLWMVSLTRLQKRQDDRQLLLHGVYAWDIAYDWINRRIYWSDDRNGTINYASISASGVTSAVTLNVAELQEPRGLAVDPFNRWLYWVESGFPRIWRYNLDTQIAHVLVSSNLSEPSGLVVDYRTSQLYWSDLSGKIETVSLNGSNRQVVYNNTLRSPFKIALYKEFLVWIDWQGDSYNIVSTEDTSIQGSVAIVPYRSRVFNSIFVVGTYRQPPTTGTLSCISNSLGCSHFCNTDEVDDTFCTCPLDYELSSDNKTCSYEGVCPVCSGECSIQGSDNSCKCPPGFRGNSCDLPCQQGTFGERCAQQCTCLNGGDCDPVLGSCTCVEGYEGLVCEQAICTQECENGGTCTEPDTCTCLETFGGLTCGQRVCTPDHCFNGGTCTEDFGVGLSCRCPSSTSGARCQFLDTILLPQQVATAVGVPLGLLFGAVLLIVLAVMGVFYYMRCVSHRKTNPLALESLNGIAATSEISETGSQPKSKTSVDKDCNNVAVQIEHDDSESPYNLYVQS